MPTTTLSDVEAVLDTLATPVVVRDLEGRNLASNTAAPAAARNTAISVIRLNDFKSINDHHGHCVGDEALLAVATAVGEVEAVGVAVATSGSTLAAAIEAADQRCTAQSGRARLRPAAPRSSALTPPRNERTEGER